MILTGSLIQIRGLGERNLVMLHFCVNRFKIFRDPSLFQETFIIPTERSPQFCRKLTAGRYPPCVPKARWVIAGGRIGRLGQIAPEEFLAGQQLSFSDFCDCKGNFLDLLEFATYIDIMKWGGNSFHVGCAGHFVLAGLLLPRCANFGIAKPAPVP